MTYAGTLAMCCSLKYSYRTDSKQFRQKHDRQIMLLCTMQPICRQRITGTKVELLHLHLQQITDSAPHKIAATGAVVYHCHPETSPADR